MRYLTYLENDGTQYIDTGLIADSSTNLYVEYYDFGNEHAVLLGARGSSATDRSYVIMPQDVYLFLDYGSVRTYLGGSARPSILQRRVVEFRGGIIYVDGVQVAAPGGTFTTPYSQLLFAFQGDNALYISSKTRIYRVTYSKNGSTIRDFRPALDNNGIACMYDEVSGQFFYNAGTGNFIYLDPGPTIQDKLVYATLLALTTQNVADHAPPVTQTMVLDSWRYQPMQKNPASVTDYLTVDFSRTYEVCVTAMCIRTRGHTQTLFGRRSTTQRQGPFFDICYNGEPYPYSYYFRHSETENIVVRKAEFPVVTGEWMVHKMTFRNGELTAKIEYRDGRTYFTESLQNVLPGPSSCIPLVGGELSTASVNEYIVTDCILDLANTYIKIGSTIVWGRRAIR